MLKRTEHCQWEWSTGSFFRHCSEFQWNIPGICPPETKIFKSCHLQLSESQVAVQCLHPLLLLSSSAEDCWSVAWPDEQAAHQAGTLTASSASSTLSSTRCWINKVRNTHHDRTDQCAVLIKCCLGFHRFISRSFKKLRSGDRDKMGSNLEGGHT